MNKTIYIVIAFVLIFGLIAASVYIYQSRPTQVQCTLEARICPDGSAVGRTGPNCEFEECPALQEPGTLEVIATIGPNCPVEIEGETCEIPDSVYTSRGIMVLNEDKIFINQTNFDENGKLTLELNPGNYSIELIPNGVDFSKDLPKEITIEKNTKLTVEISIDTGIR